VENKMTNEIQVNENQSTEIAETVVRENDQFAVVKVDGKFKRKAKYSETTTIVAETRADKVWLLNLFEGTDEKSNGLKEHVGKQISVADVITRPYDKINEETGDMEYGVLTYLITADKNAYVTSSKNVYFTITNSIKYFGNPTKEEPFVIQVLKEKGQNGDMIKIKLVG
jgi:hypothetical protein